MKIHTSAAIPTVGSFSRKAARHFGSRLHLDRPFPEGLRTGGGVRHIAEILPEVLRSITVNRRAAK